MRTPPQMHPEISAKLLLAYLSTHRSVVDSPTLRQDLADHGVGMEDFARGLAYAVDRDWIEVDSEGAFLMLTPDGKHFIQAAIWTEHGRSADDTPATTANDARIGVLAG